MNETIDKTISQVYERPLSIAMTEYLFGPRKNLDPLDFASPGVDYYVLNRVSRVSGTPVDLYHAEHELFEKFWPPDGDAQLLHIVGGSGSGKSTFIRYFFQYFLPHYERVLEGADADSPESQAHMQSVHGHVLLFVDLRIREEGNLRSEIFHSLGKSLHHEATRLGLGSFPRLDKYDEVWVRTHISQLAEEVESGKRKWYISCVVDNSDQLGEKEQKELTEIARLYVAPQIPTNDALKPVTRGDGRTLWRVIIPLRSETWQNLYRVWHPFPNRAVIELDPIDPDILMETRAKFVSSVVALSRLHREKDRPYAGSSRPGLGMWMPEEMAESLHDDLLAANKPEGTTASPAKSVLNDLISDSARRELHLLSRIAFSEVFHDRRAFGLEKKWTDPVSPFYFFDGLVRGDRMIFDSEADPFILNLYDLGADPKNRPHSIFVGLHAVWLLTHGHQWDDVKRELAGIGYPQNDLTECESWLLNKELIQALWDGRYRIESRILKGHWALLKERAYTDNMAVACAHSWGFAARAKPTDPLQATELLERFRGSLWFMQETWKAERALTLYSPHINSRCGSFVEFVASRRALQLPSTTGFVADEYLRRMTKLPKYGRPYVAIQADQQEWDKNIHELGELVRASNNPRALHPRQS